MNGPVAASKLATVFPAPGLLVMLVVGRAELVKSCGRGLKVCNAVYKVCGSLVKSCSTFSGPVKVKTAMRSVGLKFALTKASIWPRAYA